MMPFFSLILDISILLHLVQGTAIRYVLPVLRMTSSVLVTDQEETTKVGLPVGVTSHRAARIRLKMARSEAAADRGRSLLFTVAVPPWGRRRGAQAPPNRGWPLPEFSRPPNCGWAPKFGRTFDTLWSIDSQKKN